MHEEIHTAPTRSAITKSVTALLVAIAFATGTFFSGLHVGTLQALSGQETQQAGLFSLFAGSAGQPTDVELAEFWKVWELLDEKFAAATSTFSLTAEQKVQGAISGLVDTYGDPYTTYMPPTEAASFDEDISGNFSGVGMEVGMRDDVITVIAPLANTPAEKAGIMAGDVIVKIDDTTTEGMGVDEAVRKIRGEEGTPVRFSLYRQGELEIKEITVIRAKIEIPTVATKKIDDVFVISLYSFNALAEMKMQEALREYTQSGADKLVLDLRGNPGGYLQGAVAIASYFLPAGKVVLRESYGDDRPEDVYRSQGRTLKQFAPQEMVVLIDGGSASASEILAGALSQHGYGVLIGTDSFGKGSVQELVNLPSGASLKVTIARWLTPNGTSISNGGLKPEIYVERTPEDRLAGKDPQLDTALQYLHGTYVPPVASTTPAQE
jgi:carboxyl-terminal processing protease